MRRLERDQQAMMQALDRGPAYLPNSLFAGPPDRVLAGMKVYANTISHARLVALEETFPRTREILGHQQFNEHSRMYMQHPGVTALALTDIGAGFDSFLAAAGVTADLADLARFEWCWLQAYHAAEATPMELDGLTQLAPEALLEEMIMRHPSAIAGRFAPLVHDLIGAEIPGLSDADAILIARPEADVLISPASALMAELLSAAGRPVAIGNLLAELSETNDSSETENDRAQQVEAIMQSLVALINAGALITS